MTTDLNHAPALRDLAVLFVSNNLEWFAPLCTRHESSDKSRSFYGKSYDGKRDGIWIPAQWYEDVKSNRGRHGLQMHELHTPAREEVSVDFAAPSASGLPPDQHPAEMDVLFGA